MADNATLPASGTVVATDDIGGVHYQIVKMAHGALDSATIVSSTNPLPITASSTNPVVIQGVQDTATTGTITSAASTVGPLAVTQRNVVTVSVSGTYAGVTIVVEASDDGGTLWYPLQCIDNNTGQASSSFILAANGSYSYDSAIGGYTHLRVRSTAWTSGTANVRMTAQSFAYDPVVAAICQSLDVDLTMASVAAANGDLFSVDCKGVRAIYLQLTGTFAGTVTFQGSNDNTTWSTVQAFNSSTGVTATTATAVGIFAIPAHTRYLRARVTAYTSGTFTGVYRLSSFAMSPIGTTQAVSGSVSLSANTPTLAAGTNLAGDVGIQLRANATGAATVSKFTAAATTNAANIKATAGRVVGWHLTNTTASVKYFRFFNLATAPTMGTSSPYFVVPIPANGIATMSIPSGLAFATGISIACTGAVADLDTTVTAANDVIGSIWYA